MAKFIKCEEFVAESEKLIKLHEDKIIAMKQKYLEEEVELEKEFGAELDQLMDKYTPHGSEEGIKNGK